MAKEVLAVQEEDLGELIRIIRAGLRAVPVSESVRDGLTKWCDEEEKYLASMVEQ